MSENIITIDTDASQQSSSYMPHPKNDIFAGSKAISLSLKVSQEQQANAEVTEKQLELELANVRDIITNTKDAIGKKQDALNRVVDLKLILRDLLKSICYFCDQETIKEIGEEFKDVASYIYDNYDSYCNDSTLFSNNVLSAVNRMVEKESTKKNQKENTEQKQINLLDSTIISLIEDNPQNKPNKEQVINYLLEQEHYDIFVEKIKQTLDIKGTGKTPEKVAEYILDSVETIQEFLEASKIAKTNVEFAVKKNN